MLTLLPTRYSPLQPNGNGIQSIYLTELPPPFAKVLGGLIGQEAQHLTSAIEVAGATEGDRIKSGDDLDIWEPRLEERVAADTSIGDTDREAIIRARRGQCRSSIPLGATLRGNLSYPPLASYFT